MKYDVTARAFNPQTGEPLARARTERIDTRDPEYLHFAECASLLQVAEVYATYWNRPNRIAGVGDQNRENSRELVLVSKVVPV